MKKKHSEYVYIYAVGARRCFKGSNCGAIKQPWAAAATPLQSVTKLELLQTLHTFSFSLTLDVAHSSGLDKESIFQ